MVRAAVSHRTRKAPPKTAEAGSSNRWPGPSSNLQMCGDIMPTNPMGPQAATTPPTITDVATKSVVLVPATATPLLAASSEPVASRSSSRPKAKITTIPSATNGAIWATEVRSTPPRPPISQRRTR